jgi:hypothetical protein
VEGLEASGLVVLSGTHESYRSDRKFVQSTQASKQTPHHGAIGSGHKVTITPVITYRITHMC